MNAISSFVTIFVICSAISSIEGAFDASKEVFFALYTRKNPTKAQIITATSESISKSSFKASNPVRIYIHGMYNDHTGPMAAALTAAYLENGKFNVILVDWKNGAKEKFSKTKRNVPLVAGQVAELIKFLVASNLTKLETLLISGHSMGAQVAGFTGKKVPGINAIVALDVCNLSYDENKPAERLNSSDAKIVQAIHTATKLVFDYQVGIADFIVNGGSFQPGCGLDIGCSHKRAAWYYIESINSDKFITNGAVMGGEPLTKNLKGRYELSTNAEPPYAKG